MNEGWIALNRKILDNPIWLSERFTKAMAWVDLLLLANHKDSEVMVDYKPFKILRGQFMTSQVKLAKRWRWDRLSVKRFLVVMEMKQAIHMATHRAFEKGFTVITIQNYEHYQSMPQGNPQGTPQGNHRAPRRAVRINNNDNNVNNENNINNTITKVIGKSDKRNPDIEECRNYFLFKFSLPTEDGNTMWNRRYWMHLIREGGRGVAGVKALIDLAHEDRFWRSNITSATNLYRNRVKIVSQKRGSIPHIAVMPKEVV